MKNEKYESFDDRHLGVKTKQNQKSLNYKEVYADRFKKTEKKKKKKIDVEIQYINIHIQLNK